MDYFTRVFYLALAATGIYGIVAAQSFKATAYPATLGVILCVCSLIQFARTFRASPAEEKKSPQLSAEQRAVIWTMLATLAYILLMRPLGFILASILFMGGLMWLHGYRHIWRIVAITLPLAFGLYFFFTRVVHIALPSGILPF